MTVFCIVKIHPMCSVKQMLRMIDEVCRLYYCNAVDPKGNVFTVWQSEVSIYEYWYNLNNTLSLKTFNKIVATVTKLKSVINDQKVHYKYFNRIRFSYFLVYP